MTSAQRKEALMPQGIPKWVRVYDNGGETFDRYTVCFTKKRINASKEHRNRGQFWHVGMSSFPFHPQGFGQHGESNEMIDRPTYGHLGKRIKFDDLPEDCQKLVINTYKYLWDIDQPKED